MTDFSIMNERLKKIFSTIYLKIRHPSVKTGGYHMVTPGTEIILRKKGTLSLGKNVSTYKRVTFSVYGGHLKIGENVSFNRNSTIVCNDTINIGDGCAFGPNVVIYDHDHIFSADGFAMGQFRSSPIEIEDHCWIGANVTILRGTHIGRGSVIGAGTVVKGDIPSFSLVTGNRELHIETIR